MRYHIEQSGGKSAYMQLYEQLRKDIVSGSYTYGAKLPSKRLLAEEAGVSEVYLRRMFKERYGQTPSEHIVSVRLAHARALMSDPVLSLEECALQSGFSSSSGFYQTFRQICGMSPTEYLSSFDTL
jgi:AraC-like DNA-binding protein